MAIRNGTNVKLFINGTQIGSTGTNSSNIDNANAFTVGYGGTNYFNGLMDNIRIAKGVARYTATFDPPYDPVAETATGNFFLLF
jgi:hypothetical protein